MSIKIHINSKTSKKIYKDSNILLESNDYVVCDNIELESPCSVTGVKMHLPFYLGAFTHINAGGVIQNCTIGRYCAIGTGVKIGNGNHPTNWLSVNACQYIKNFRNYDNIFENKISLKEFTPYLHTIIGNDVWIGANAFIKEGIKIGDGAIIGANSVVTHDVEPYAIVAGTPAKLIRYRFTPEIIKELQELKWWEYNITEFGEIDFDDIEKAIAKLKEVLPNLKPYKPKIIDSKYLSRIIPTKKQFFGLIKTYIDDKYKYKYFCSRLLYKKELKKEG